MMDYLYYNSNCNDCAGIVSLEQEIEFPDNIAGRVLKRIYEQFNVANDLDPDLFYQTLKEINEAVDAGLPSMDWGTANKAFVDALKYNNAVFAAFKTHRQQNDLSAQLVNENGEAKDFNTFRKDCAPIIKNYNSVWLKTEHDTAVKSARTAARFADFERDKDLFPNLKWIRSRALEPRFSHKLYYNSIRSMSDPWFKTHYPGCVWGCQCDINNTDAPITHVGNNPVVAASKTDNDGTVPGLDKNPYYTKSIFSQTHPYVTQGYQPVDKLKKILIPLIEKLLKQK